MSKEIKVTYKNGVPSIKTLMDLASAFDPKMNVYPNPSYGKQGIGNALIWHDAYTQSRIEDFKTYLFEKDLRGIGQIDNWESYVPGSLGWLHFNPIAQSLVEPREMKKSDTYFPVATLVDNK